jgi:hypothetical protein
MSIAQAGDSGYWGVKIKGHGSLCIANSSGNGYRFFISDTVVWGRLWVSHASSGSNLNTGAYSTLFNSGEYNTITVHRNNSTNVWTIYINGTQYETFTDSTYTAFGYVELEGSATGATPHFRNPFYHATDPTPTGNFTSQTIDYGAAVSDLSDFGNLVAHVDIADGGAVTFQTLSAESSDMATNPDPAGYVNVGTAGENGGAINSIAKRYLRWKALFTTTNAGDNPKVYEVFVGTQYISSTKDATAVPTDTGRFLVTEDVPASAEIAYYLRTAATEEGLSSATWYRVAPQDFIDYPTFFSSSEDWLQFKVVMKMTNYEEVPTLDRVTVEYYIGAKVDTPAAKTWKGIYHLAVDEDWTGKNDVVYVCNENGAWAKDTNVDIGCWASYKSRLMTGSSKEGFVRWMYDGTSDDGGLIPFRLTTRDVYAKSAEHYEDQDKCFRRIWPTAKSVLPYRVRSLISTEDAWKSNMFDASKKVLTQRQDLPGMNTGQYIRYQIKPSHEDFSESPYWPNWNGADEMFWHEGKYIYLKSTQSKTISRRYYTMLDRYYDENDEMGFWVKLEPTALGANSIMRMGFFNTANIDNWHDSICFEYFHAATKYCRINIYPTTGNPANSVLGNSSALTADTVYYVNFVQRKDGTVSLYLYDSNVDIVTWATISLGTREFDVNAFGFMNYYDDEADESEWKIWECMPFFVPSTYPGLTGKTDFEFHGMEHEFIPMQRLT